MESGSARNGRKNVDDRKEGASHTAVGVITHENESPHCTALADGLERVRGDEIRRAPVEVAVVLSDRRLVFADPSAPDDGNTGAVLYRDLADVTRAHNHLAVETVAGVTWRLSMDADDRLADVEAGLRWLGRIRTRLRSIAEHVETAAERLQSATGTGDWAVGSEVYDDVRGLLDDVAAEVFLTRPVSADALAPELTALERTLEAAYAMMLASRGSERADRGEAELQAGEEDTAASLLQAARKDCDGADAHGAALDRADGFAFGEHRALEERLERLDQAIDGAATEIHRLANRATIRARSTTDSEETVAHWERAHRRFQTARTIASHDHGDRSAIQRDSLEAANELAIVHRTLARTNWEAGQDAVAVGDRDDAIGWFSTAIDHLERIRDLAETVDAGDADAMERVLETARGRLEGIRSPGEQNGQQGTTPTFGGPGREAGLEFPGGLDLEFKRR